MANWRKSFRSWHRNLGYLTVIITLIYAITGIGLNHLSDWNPSYEIIQESIPLNQSIPAQWTQENIQQVLNRFDYNVKYRKHYQNENGKVKVFIDGGTLLIDPETQQAYLEMAEKRLFFYQANKLHYNKKSFWIWVADFYAVALIFLALSGLVMNKGRNGLQGKGKWWALAGLMIPIFYLTFLS